MSDPAVPPQGSASAPQPLPEPSSPVPTPPSAFSAEVLAMQLHGPHTADAQPEGQPGEIDPRLQLARSLDHIDEISAQLADIHELIEPQDELFGRTEARWAAEQLATAAPRPAVSVTSSASAANDDPDDTSEAPLWHGPELGNTMRLPASRNVTVAAELKSTPERVPRRGGIRRRLVPLAVAAAVLAIPAMVIASVQPWRDGGMGGGGTGPLRGGQDEAAIATSWQPGPTSEPVNSEVMAPAPPARVYNAGTSTRSGAVPAPRRRSPIPSTSPKAGEVAPLVVVSAKLVGASPVVGSQANFEVTWRDGSGYFGALTYTASDGSAGGLPDRTKNCHRVAPANGDTRTMSHTFTQSGTKTITFTLSTYTCDGEQESAQVTVTVDVAPAPEPSKSPKSPKSPKTSRPPS